ncbi:hypothetical protein H6G94_01130 [Nostoc punctiforme FACHB-252]|uniref:Uncharacterized protein n=1 Tax=Nostoc punctiforme FACHB-252 TaxID=1357509 RepID=A0ABR8H3S3_NOSPU|nr:hypothetical protein [Nostoc punctiforme]MBD2609890.1 hypothetical protein [Nostoc punctiforme FACHB-252]
MNEQKIFSYQLLELLNQINFSQKYYDYYAKSKENSSQEKSVLKTEDFAAALSSTSLDFSYNKKERFFHYEENNNKWQFELNISFSKSYIELILSVENELLGYAGGPFPKLAREAAQLSNPNFQYSPASPKIPFSNREELQEAVNFGVSLFEEIKQAILSKQNLVGYSVESLG